VVVFTATALALMGVIGVGSGALTGALATTALGAPTYVGTADGALGPDGSGIQDTPPTDIERVATAATTVAALYVGAKILEKV